MSDGPYKSLPMPPAWKRVAKRAANPTFAPGEICEALLPALERDWRDEVPPELVQGIDHVLGGPRPLFKDENIQQLESLRPITSAHGFGQDVLDCAIQLAIDGEGGPKTVEAAVANALAVRASRGAHQVEEHYLRSSQAPRAQDVRARIDEGIRSAPLTDLARQLLNRDSRPVPRNATKQQGLDNGVPL
jgi:hypothetical protein